MALAGRFHLVPAPHDYLRQVMADFRKFGVEHVMPMHCSGQNSSIWRNWRCRRSWYDARLAAASRSRITRCPSWSHMLIMQTSEIVCLPPDVVMERTEARRRFGTMDIEA